MLHYAPINTTYTRTRCSNFDRSPLCSECFLFPPWPCAARMDFHRARSSVFEREENQRKNKQSDPAAAEAVGVWEPAWITQRSFLNTALQFPRL